MTYQKISHVNLQTEILEILGRFGPSSIWNLAQKTHRGFDTIKGDVKKLEAQGKVICVHLPVMLLVSLTSKETEKRRKLNEFYSQKAEKE